MTIASSRARSPLDFAFRTNLMTAPQSSASSTFVNIGERTNVTASAAFKKLILADDYAAAVEFARQQVENGAPVIDAHRHEGLHYATTALTTFFKLIVVPPT